MHAVDDSSAILKSCMGKGGCGLERQRNCDANSFWVMQHTSQTADSVVELCSPDPSCEAAQQHWLQHILKCIC